MLIWAQRTTVTFLIASGILSALVAFFGGLLPAEWPRMGVFVFASVGFFAGAQELRPRRRTRPPNFDLGT